MLRATWQHEALEPCSNFKFLGFVNILLREKRPIIDKFSKIGFSLNLSGVNRETRESPRFDLKFQLRYNIKICKDKMIKILWSIGPFDQVMSSIFDSLWDRLLVEAFCTHEKVECRQPACTRLPFLSFRVQRKPYTNECEKRASCIARAQKRQIIGITVFPLDEEIRMLLSFVRFVFCWYFVSWKLILLG